MSKADEDYAFGLYPDGSGVLRNKLGLRDAQALKQAEYQITSERTADAPAFPPTQAGYQALHRYLFSPVFEWAGELRTMDLGKGGSRFATARFLDATLKTIFTDLAQQDFLRGRTGERFADGAAHHVSELNVAHPFREGNGRAMRLHLQQLAEQAGHSIDQTRIPKKEWIDASIRGFEGDERPMAAVIAGALRPARLILPDAAVAELREAAEPARLQIQEATRAVRGRLGTSRAAAAAIEGYRGELEQLGRADSAAERLAEAGAGPGLLQVHAPSSATARDRAQALLGAASRLPSSLVVPSEAADPTAPGQVETQAAYTGRTAPGAPQSAFAVQGSPAAAPSPDTPRAPRPVRPSRDPGPGS